MNSIWNVSRKSKPGKTTPPIPVKNTENINFLRTNPHKTKINKTEFRTSSLSRKTDSFLLNKLIPISKLKEKSL